jgi:hypothetical protein
VWKYNTSCINTGTDLEKIRLLMSLQGNLQYLDSTNQMYFIFYSGAYRPADVAAYLTELWKSLNYRVIPENTVGVEEIAHA